MCVSLTSNLFGLRVPQPFFSVMLHLVGRSASPAATRRLFPRLCSQNEPRRVQVGRVPASRGYIGAVTRTFDLIDSSPSRTWPSCRQARARRHLVTTSKARHAEPLPDAYLNFKFSTDTSMASLVPPQDPPTWQHSVEDIERLTTEVLAKNQKISNDIVHLPADKLDFDSVRTLSLCCISSRSSDCTSVFRYL